MLGDPQSGRPAKKQNTKEQKKKKSDAEKKQKKKTVEKLGTDGKGLLDEIEEDDKEDKRDSDVSDSDGDTPDDKYDPLSRQKEGGPKLKKQSMLQSAVEQTALELGKAMPVMSRGPELELSTIKDVEDLKHALAQAMIHVPNDVLRRAIILPKDIDTSDGRYASPKDLLPKNPALDPELLFKEKEHKKLMRDLIKWGDNTFERKKKKEEDGEEEVDKKKIAKNTKKRL